MNTGGVAPPRISRQFRRSVTAPSPFDNFNGKSKLQMSEFPVEGSGEPPGGEPGSKLASVMENFQRKNSLSPRPPPAQQHLIGMAAASAQQQQLNSSASSAQQMVSSSSSSSSTTTSRVAKSSQRVHHISSSEMKASSMKSDLSELKSSISEMKNLSTQNLKKLNSNEDAASDTGGGGATNEPLITFPDPDTPPPSTAGQIPPISLLQHSASQNGLSNISSGTSSISSSSAETLSSEVKFEQKHVKVVSEERSRLEVDGVTAEKALNMLQEQRHVKSGEVTQQESQNVSAASMRLHSDTFCAEKTAMAAQQQRQTVTSTGIFNHEKHMAQSSQSNYTILTKGVSTKSSHSSSSSQVSQLMNGAKQSTMLKCIGEDIKSAEAYDDLERLTLDSDSQDIERAIRKYSLKLDSIIQSIKRGDERGKKAPQLLNMINEMLRKAWAVPAHGHELGYSLCNVLRNCGGLDLLMANCDVDDRELQFSSARLLEQCLTTENRTHVVENGLEKVVTVACVCTKNANSVDHSRVGTGILEHLFKHSEGTCSDVIRLGGLDAVLFECRKNDVETLRHCAGALANLSLYGGAENQEAMIKRKVPMWLFPLAFHNDDNIKYYACLAIAVLVANAEIEAAVLKSGTLDLVEPFVTSHNPSEFAKSNLAHAHGQSQNWLQRLVPVLSSNREEASNLAAFHFCMEAGIKKQQGKTNIFGEIGAIEPLKKVASCPNAVASKYAAQALRLIGEEVPHKLSQQVPLWSSEDVREWVKQIGFAEYANNFIESRVDGDLLLQLNEENLKDDIGISNGIRRIRFTRELQNLKKMADYSSRDVSNLNTFLQSIGHEFSIYTYSMLNAGVDKDSIRDLSESQLIMECGIKNSIHRIRILDAIRSIESNLDSSQEQNLDKSLDVFVSYRRSNGSQLASLLKVHLQLRGFSVFIDVERLEAGKFDNNLLQSIRQAKHFLLVLTPRALERCTADTECKDWVHREIVAALQSQCNIIPIIDNFQWPEPEELPEDMRAVCHFNGVRWIHDYQDACVDKLERFMRGELNSRMDCRGGPMSSNASAKGDVTPSTPSIVRQQPNFQRMHSNDSSKGSDKDGNGGRD